MPIAVLVPDTALLVPGVSGRTSVLSGVRSAALRAARELVESEPPSLVVLAPAAGSRTVDAKSLCVNLAPLGIAERFVGWPAPCSLDGCPEHLDASRAPELAATATAVGVRLLTAAGWNGPTTVVELAAGDVPLDPPPGFDVAGVLVLGSLSARREDDSPRAADPRARELDAAIAADLGAPDELGIERLRSLDLALADELDVSGARPWRAVASWLAGSAVTSSEEAAELELGMDYRVWTWRWGT